MGQFRRNRDNKVADALKRLREQKLGFQYPQFCRDYQEFAELRKLKGQMQKRFTSLTASASDDIANNRLEADKATVVLFTSATLIKTTQQQIARAQLRMSLGNPPGKPGSLGDAINWEALLETVPPFQDLIFISGDRDYVSPLQEDTFHSFLQDEWNSAKGGRIIFSKRIGSFFKDYFPNSQLATDLEKESLIKDLAASGSFATTHSVISRLASYGDFNNSQRNQLLQAALSNNQVYLIAEDTDVKEFFDQVVTPHEAELDADSVAEWRRRVAGQPATQVDNDDDLPF